MAPVEVKDIAVWGMLREGRVQPAPAGPKVASGKASTVSSRDAVLTRDVALITRAALAALAPGC